jgi:hypothetical protein
LGGRRVPQAAVNKPKRIKKIESVGDWTIAVAGHFLSGKVRIVAATF